MIMNSFSPDRQSLDAGYSILINTLKSKQSTHLMDTSSSSSTSIEMFLLLAPSCPRTLDIVRLAEAQSFDLEPPLWRRQS